MTNTTHTPGPGRRDGMKTYTVRSLLAAYRFARVTPNGLFKIDWRTTLTSEEWLRWFRQKLQEKVSATIAGYGTGRKWEYQWQVEAERTARAVNTPRLAVHWIPYEFRARLAHRLYQD